MTKKTKKETKKIFVKITNFEGIGDHIKKMLKGKLQLIVEKEIGGKIFGLLLNEKGQRPRIPKMNYELKTKKK